MSDDFEDLKKYFNFDIYADIYDQTRNISSSFSSLFSLIMKKAQIPAHSRPLLLELGAGTGIVVELLSKSKKISPQYVGIDISKKMLQKIKEKYDTTQVNLILADAYTLPFKDHVFDLTLLIRTIHLLSNWKTALWELRRCLRKNQLLIIVTGGPGLKIINQCYSNDEYIKLREKYGAPLFYYGADWQNVPKFIEHELNGTIEQLEGSHKVVKKLKDILIEFRNQLMTWHKQIDKPAHDKIVAELEECLLQHYGSLDVDEEQNGFFTVAFVRF